VVAVKQQRFVVGVDGSAGGRAALRWAVAQAAEHDGDSIHAIAAWHQQPATPGAAVRPHETQKSLLTEMLIEEIDALPANKRERVEITTAVTEGAAGNVLAEASRDADVLVLGTHGHGKAWHRMFGWTSDQCVRKVTCPVVIVPIAPDLDEMDESA
jgi:nucleotide-binding universal stress UspA family protein